MDPKDESPASKDVVWLRYELVETNTEAHITFVNSEQMKIKSIGRMELVKRIKGSSETDFFPVKIKLFHRKEMSCILSAIEAKDCDQTREKMKKKKLGNT